MLTFETWPIDRCIDYARNPRKNDHAVDRVAAAIKEFGFRVPIVAKSDGLVVDGHLRLKAAKNLDAREIALRVSPLARAARILSDLFSIVLSLFNLGAGKRNGKGNGLAPKGVGGSAVRRDADPAA